MKKNLLLISSICLYIMSVLFMIIYTIYELNSGLDITENGRIFLLLMICLFIYFGSFCLSKYLDNIKPMKISLWIFFILYLSLFFTLTLFDPMWGRSGLTFINWSKELLHDYIKTSCNIIPFRTIIGYIRDFDSLYATSTIFFNLFGNLICLMPFSFFLLILFPKQKNWKRFLLTTIILVLSIEFIQFITISGSCDIDDIILNTVGAIIMYLFLKIETVNNLIRNIFLIEKNKLQKKVLAIIFVVITILLILFGICLKYRQHLFQVNTDKHTNKYNYKMEIVEDVDSCASALETFYEDELFLYQFSCIKSDNVYAIINDSEKYLVKDLLNDNQTKYYIDIERLEYAGLEFIRTDKYQHITFSEKGNIHYELEIKNKDVLEVKSDGGIFDTVTTKFNLYLVPKKEGTTNLIVNLYNENQLLTDTKNYLIEIDSDLNASYKKF